MNIKPMSIVAGVTTILALISGIIAFDSRYAKQSDFEQSLDSVKTAIITEMRREVVKNRSVMIAAMQREADDLEYQITLIESRGEPVPRYMTDKYKQILRQLATLKNEDTNP